MLLDEDPAVLIRETVANFTIHNDRNSLLRINDSLSTLNSARALNLSGEQSTLKKLTRQLHTLQQQHSLTTGGHDAAAHASNILELDTKKFRVAKEASDLEVEGERVEGELGGVERTLEGLEREGDEGEFDGSSEERVLKLKLYRSLGIDIEGSDTAEDMPRKAVVRNGRLGKVHIIEMDQNVPRKEYANEVWQHV